MDIFVGRQPIFNKNYEVVAYELFYRSGEKNFYNALDGNRATMDVLINSFMNIGIDKLTNGTRCFINFTETLLKKRIPFHFPKNLIVVEILETIPYSYELLQICKELKKEGYMIALDDFIFLDQYIPLFPYIDIIKVDFSQSNNYKLYDSVIKSHHIHLLAEKIETSEQLDEAMRNGFVYFQGYFFSKPIVVREKSLPKMSHNSYFSLLKQLNKNELNFEELVETIEHDPSLTYRLLKTVNSFFLSSSPKIKSIRHAAILLGTNHLKSWLTVLAFQQPNEPFKNEVIVNSLLRAKTLEQLAHFIGLSDEKEMLFFMGICSSFHLLLDRSLHDVLEELHVDEIIQQALEGRHPLYSSLFELVLSLETNDNEQTKQLAKALNIPTSEAFATYQKSIEWIVQIQSGWVNL
ncbi:EAL domain-containing protein [Anoxybacillus kestanbolensis]|uniref:EAL domain-containing protein n=1 Tax=Anoxybacillus kestanbolensis TaxID=227476 RepID=A0A1V3FXB5_9BACL|nr:HDOD domain-containing protein [Anoxybacillus kestanbolensis]OOE06327.1 EAL domain-containing protein [Anoxybacillus kestanbolensis]